MSTRSKVLFGDNLAGYLEKYDNGYRFTYESEYLTNESAKLKSKPSLITISLSKQNSVFIFRRPDSRGLAT